MTRPIGFYGCNTGYELISGIIDTWGESLELLNDGDRFYLLHIITERIGLNSPDYPTDACDEACGRIVAKELPPEQMAALIRRSRIKALSRWVIGDATTTTH